MSEFKPGEIVRITIENARVESVGEDLRNGSRFVRLGLPVNGEILHGRVHLDADGVTVERVAPAEWPPQPGDLWAEVDGALWFAQSLGGSQMSFIPARVRGEIDSALPAYVLETFGPLTLVYREGGEQS